MSLLLRAAGPSLALLALAPLAIAQAPAPTPTPAAPNPAHATGNLFAAPSNRWHLHGTFGLGAADGKYGDVLQKPLQWDIGIARQSPSGAWRFGANLQFGSMDPAADPNIDPDKVDEWLAPDKEWARLETSLSVRRVLRPRAGFRPYLEGRVGIERIHPRSELFYNKPEEGLEPGESPTYATNGIGFTVQPGFEWSLGRTLSLDASFFFTYYKTGAYDMSPLGLPDVDSGHEWGGRLGLAWRPFAAFPEAPPRAPWPADPATGRLLPLPPSDGDRDAWGVPRSWGWATAEMFAINWGAAMFNEYVRDANFNQISPRSFWANVEEGFTYDDNEFKTNQLIHPFNGSTYYNAARANGIGFWGSSAMAIAGAFVWECCGETHPMSFNDMVSTGIGGIARGEIAYRISSLILDNTKRGKGRFGREAAAFLFDPVRGFNRIVSGDAAEVKGNPVDPYDWRPEFQLSIRAGARVMGEGESITENTKTYGFMEWVLNYGDPWDGETEHRPYDRFDVAAQSNFGDKTRLGRLLIRGDVFTKPLGNGAKHVLTFQQDFDYINNEAYEYGGQSLGPALLSQWTGPGKLRFFTRLQAYGILLGGINSDYSWLADVAEQERIREYDYGPGVGGAAEVYLQRKNLPLVTARYRYSYIDVSNGSLYNGQNAGLESTHDIHQAAVKLEIPITRSLAIGADGSVFFRRSRYDVTSATPEFGPAGRHTITQRNPEARVFLAWTYNH
jgi:hypothetical protein